MGDVRIRTKARHDTEQRQVPKARIHISNQEEQARWLTEGHQANTAEKEVSRG